MANVFISYRREDAAGHAGRLCDRLTARFGHARVFMDLQDIGPGENFAQSIDDTIAACECVVVVIGPRWLDSLQKRADGEDFVQHEIAAALRRAVTIIPVLVGGARMPSIGQLPPELAALGYRNALEVRDERFDEDAARLVDAVGAHVPARAAGGGLLQSTRARAVVAVLAVAVLVGVVAAWRALSPAAIHTAATPRSSVGAFDGDWIAEMRKEGQPPYRIRLSFVTAGDVITGMVRYPTGEGPILEPQLTGDVLTFHTAHVPQFESSPAIIRFQAQPTADEIRLTVTDDFGISTGVATRRPPAP